MTNYHSHYQKKQFKKTLLMVFILLIIFYFLLTVGIKILILTSSSIANFFFKKETTNETLKTINPLPGTIYLDSIPTATNSGSIIISGSVENFDILDLYLNDKKIKTIEINEDHFETTLENLKENDNNYLYIIAKNLKNKTSKKTEVYSIYYKKDKPKLTIISPKDEEKLTNNEVTIIGETDKEVIIEINNQPVVVNLNGHFESTIKLNDGENLIKITAQDIAGNVEEKNLKLYYQKE